uniref:Uncharacterized protein n=1 Tax=Cacopsylla melanoneura TaxID=428564 RepID=A0A8D8UBU0_9HEMI
MSVYYQNTRSVRGKLKELTCGLSAHESDIYFFTETWLMDSVNSAELGFQHHSVYRTDRSSENSNLQDGGGVLIAVKKNIPSYQVSINNNKSEALFVHVKYKTTKIILGCCYLNVPSAAAITNLTEVLNEVLLKFHTIR